MSVILGRILGTCITGWIITLSHVGEGSGWVELLSTTAITGVIAVALIELSHDVFDTHEYLDSLKNIKDAAFAECYEEYRAKYVI